MPLSEADVRAKLLQLQAAVGSTSPRVRGDAAVAAISLMSDLTFHRLRSAKLPDMASTKPRKCGRRRPPAHVMDKAVSTENFRETDGLCGQRMEKEVSACHPPDKTASRDGYTCDTQANLAHACAQRPDWDDRFGVAALISDVHAPLPMHSCWTQHLSTQRPDHDLTSRHMAPERQYQHRCKRSPPPFLTAKKRHAHAPQLLKTCKAPETQCGRKFNTSTLVKTSTVGVEHGLPHSQKNSWHMSGWAPQGRQSQARQTGRMGTNPYCLKDAVVCGCRRPSCRLSLPKPRSRVGPKNLGPFSLKAYATGGAPDCSIKLTQHSSSIPAHAHDFYMVPPGQRQDDTADECAAPLQRTAVETRHGHARPGQPAPGLSADSYGCIKPEAHNLPMKHCKGQGCGPNCHCLVKACPASGLPHHRAFDGQQQGGTNSMAATSSHVHQSKTSGGLESDWGPDPVQPAMRGSSHPVPDGQDTNQGMHIGKQQSTVKSQAKVNTTRARIHHWESGLHPETW